MNLDIPDGLTNLLQNFTVEVVRSRPNDLITFAIDYFEQLHRNRQIPNGLSDLLQKFTIEVIRKNPNDLLAFAVEYFQDLFDKREKNNASESSNKIANRRSTVYYNSKDENEIDDDVNEEITDEEDIEEISLFTKSKSFGSRRLSVAAEKYNPEDDSEENFIFNQKSSEERKYLRKIVTNILVFRSLDNKQIDKIIDAMFARYVVEDDVIIEQGADGDNFYVIESGVYDILVNDNKVGSYNNEGSFGELALMYNMPRAATIKAKEHGKLWALDRLTFKKIVLKATFERRKMYEHLIENMPMFKSLNTYDCMNLADALYSRSFEDGEAIINQGDQAKCMYFVESGRVKIVREHDGQVKEIKICNKSDYFGELALLTKKPRAATAIALGYNVKCAVLDIDAFERLLGPCVEIMQKNIPDYRDQLKKLFGENIKFDEIGVDQK